MPRFLFKKVTICGVGFMGGSLGLALQKHSVAESVWGYGRNRKRLDRARTEGIITHATTNLEAAAEEADFVVVCLPVGLIPRTVLDFGEVVPDRAILTDIGSTKVWIVSEIEDSIRQPGPYFVGSHPMCGSERSGFEFARDDLYEGATCVVTKNPKTDEYAAHKTTDFWTRIGGEVLVLTPEEHDRLAARTSHLPRVTAAALCQALEREMDADKRDKLVATGFLGATRTAVSDEETWTQILDTNREFLLDALGDLQAVLQVLHDILSYQDRDMLKNWLAESRLIRERLNNARNHSNVSTET